MTHMRSQARLAETYGGTHSDKAAIPTNPARGTTQVHRPRQETKALRVEDLIEIRAAVRRWVNADRPGPKATGDMADIIDLMLATGCRIGEVLALRWSDLDRVKLRYYSTRRNRSRGWMTLKLGTGWTTISVDSTIDGFDAIAGRAARAITDNGIGVDEVTLANLAALGLTADAGEVRTGSVELSR